MSIRDQGTHNDPKVLTDLRKRKLINMQKVIAFKISKGPKFSTEFVEQPTDLTEDMIKR